MKVVGSPVSLDDICSQSIRTEVHAFDYICISWELLSKQSEMPQMLCLIT